MSMMWRVESIYSSPSPTASRISTESWPSMLSKYTFTRSRAEDLHRIASVVTHEEDLHLLGAR